MAECAVVALSAPALGPELARDKLVLVRLGVVGPCPLRTDELLLGYAVVAHSLALGVLVGVVALLRSKLLALSRHLREYGSQVRGHIRLRLLGLGERGILKLFHHVQNLREVNTSTRRRRRWLGSRHLDRLVHRRLRLLVAQHADGSFEI